MSSLFFLICFLSLLEIYKLNISYSFMVCFISQKEISGNGAVDKSITLSNAVLLKFYFARVIPRSFVFHTIVFKRSWLLAEYFSPLRLKSCCSVRTKQSGTEIWGTFIALPGRSTNTGQQRPTDITICKHTTLFKNKFAHPQKTTEFCPVNINSREGSRKTRKSRVCFWRCVL